MNKSNQSGAYIIKHPYNQNRLMLHYFWTGDQLSDQTEDPFMAKALESLNFSNHFYQYYVLNNTGKSSSEQRSKIRMRNFLQNNKSQASLSPEELHSRIFLLT